MQTDLTAKYESERARLNPAQREAVETIDGPVMVLAGPGTGKTQVLAFRIAEILLKTDMSEKNILALTFTESGVVAMRERLVSLIGTRAYGVNIYTFHGFTNRIINDAGAAFYRSHTLAPIDDITQLKVVMDLLDTLSLPKLRPTRAPYFYVKPALHAIKQLKNEGVTPDRLRELCEAEIENLKNDPASLSKSGKSKGELKQSVRDAIEKLERSCEVATLFAAYQEKLVELGHYDYEDMLVFVVEAFRTNSALKAKYQEQFQYILVDEYQDTNSIQNNLIQLLGDYFDAPNIFVVGDDKQSIYRFQGASMANLVSFLAWYPKAKVISLEENYRSGQPILNAAHALIEHNQEQLSKQLSFITTQLHAQHSSAEVCFTAYRTDDQEVLGIVSQIEQLRLQGLPLKEIAIIYRENSEAAGFADLLQRKGIPFHLEVGNDVLKDGDIRQIMNLLELAANPENEFALFRYLYAPYTEIRTEDLVRLGQWRKRERATWLSLLDCHAPPDPHVTTWAAIQTALTRVMTWHRYQQHHNVGDSLEFVLRDSGLLGYMMTQPDHLLRLQRMRAFFDDVKAMVSSIPFATLTHLFARIEVRQNYNLPLMASSPIETVGEAVQLMTAHKSKGLEFGHVFIPHFYDGLWSNNRKASLITFPDGIVPHHRVHEEQSLEEERRLCYVAVTRAKEAVYISSHDLDGNQRKRIACQFLSELGDVTHRVPATKDPLLSVVDFFSPVTASFQSQATQAYLRELVQQMPLSPTGLNTFLTCPLEYLFKDVYCIPGVREPFQSYGTAIHKALEYWGKSSMEGRTLTKEHVLTVFTDTLIREGLTQDEVTRYQTLGADVLGAYYEAMRENWITPLALEYSFKPHNVMLDGVIPITGKFDKIEPIVGRKEVCVVDYKTGRVKSRNEIEGKTTSSDGDYKRQLVFYAVLAEADPFFPYTVGEAAIAFIDDQKKFTVERFVITNEEKQELKALIAHIWQEITQLHFDHTPHKIAFGAGESLCDILRYGYTEGLGEASTMPYSRTNTPVETP